MTDRVSEKPHEIQLHITGMTCASCAAHVEKALNQIDGIDASVNYATERATVSSLDELDESQLIQAVIQTGYSAESLQALPHNQQPQKQQQQDSGDRLLGEDKVVSSSDLDTERLNQLLLQLWFLVVLLVVVMLLQVSKQNSL